MPRIHSLSEFASPSPDWSWFTDEERTEQRELAHDLMRRHERGEIEKPDAEEAQSVTDALQTYILQHPREARLLFAAHLAAEQSHRYRLARTSRQADFMNWLRSTVSGEFLEDELRRAPEDALDDLTNPRELPYKQLLWSLGVYRDSPYIEHRDYYDQLEGELKRRTEVGSMRPTYNEEEKERLVAASY